MKIRQITLGFCAIAMCLAQNPLPSPPPGGAQIMTYYRVEQDGKWGKWSKWTNVDVVRPLYVKSANLPVPQLGIDLTGFVPVVVDRTTTLSIDSSAIKPGPCVDVTGNPVPLGAWAVGSSHFFTCVPDPQDATKLVWGRIPIETQWDN